jgi:hypothetical protein
MRRGVDMWTIFHRLVCCVVLLLGLGAAGHTEERWRGHERDQRGFPFTERWEGSRTWKPDLPRGWDRPDGIIIDRPGKCEVRCERDGRAYRCREYRC